MAEEAVSVHTPPPSYVEVTCKTSGKIRRFASGIDAGSAVTLINRRLNRMSARALHIEAVKEGEEPIAFGPNLVLVSYGDGWKLQTFTEADAVLIPRNFGPEGTGYMGFRTFTEAGEHDFEPMATPVSSGSHPTRKLSNPISFLYLVKIVFAFILIFVLGAILTLALENLPAMMSYVSSSI